MLKTNKEMYKLEGVQWIKKIIELSKFNKILKAIIPIK